MKTHRSSPRPHQKFRFGAFSTGPVAAQILWFCAKCRCSGTVWLHQDSAPFSAFIAEARDQHASIKPRCDGTMEEFLTLPDHKTAKLPEPPTLLP